MTREQPAYPYILSIPAAFAKPLRLDRVLFGVAALAVKLTACHGWAALCFGLSHLFWVYLAVLCHCTHLLLYIFTRTIALYPTPNCYFHIAFEGLRLFIILALFGVNEKWQRPPGPRKMLAPVVVAVLFPVPKAFLQVP